MLAYKRLTLTSSITYTRDVVTVRLIAALCCGERAVLRL